MILTVLIHGKEKEKEIETQIHQCSCINRCCMDSVPVSNAGVPWGQAPIKPLNEGCIIRQF